MNPFEGPFQYDLIEVRGLNGLDPSPAFNNWLTTRPIRLPADPAMLRNANSVFNSAIPNALRRVPVVPGYPTVNPVLARFNTIDPVQQKLAAARSKSGGVSRGLSGLGKVNVTSAPMLTSDQGMVPDAVMREAKLKKLGLPSKTAKAVARTAMVPGPGIVRPSDVLTQAGAKSVALAGKKAQAAGAYHAARVEMLSRKAQLLAAQAARLPKGSKRRAALELDATVAARQILEEQANASRSAVVAGAARAALNFRQKAERTRDPKARRKFERQATMSIDAAQKVTTTPVRVTLPFQLGANNIRSLAEQAGLPVLVTAISMSGSPGLPAHPSVSIPQLGPTYPNTFSPPMIPQVSMPGDMLNPEASRLRSVSQTVFSAGLGELGQLDGILDDIIGGVVGVVKELVPPHTIVGKALRGDVSGATQDTVKLVTGKAPVQPPAPPPLPPEKKEVQDAITAGAQQTVPQVQTKASSDWIPLAIGGGALAVVAALTLI